MKRICLFLLFLLTCSLNKIDAQTYCYKYLYSVRDEIKISTPFTKENMWYFTFTRDKSRCYLTDKNGVSGGGGYPGPVYQYLGKRSGIHIYKEADNMFRKGCILYFSSDFKRLNWRCYSDEYFPGAKGSLRVLDLVENPNEIEMPSQLY